MVDLLWNDIQLYLEWRLGLKQSFDELFALLLKYCFYIAATFPTEHKQHKVVDHTCPDGGELFFLKGICPLMLIFILIVQLQCNCVVTFPLLTISSLKLQLIKVFSCFRTFIAEFNKTHSSCRTHPSWATGIRLYALARWLWEGKYLPFGIFSKSVAYICSAVI